MFETLPRPLPKPLRSTYKPGDRRSWLKVKNRAYWKYAIEREAVTSAKAYANIAP